MLLRLLIVLLLAAAMRFHALAHDVRFHPDEALFSTFARDAVALGDWRLLGDLDKPPLAIYANALSHALVAATYGRGVPDFDPRTGEFAARLPGTFASLVQVAAVYALAWRLYRRADLALWAALLVALSPFAIAYSASAYTDGLMLALASLALWQSAARHPLWAGVWLALAFASKFQALYFLPLCALLIAIQPGAALRRDVFRLAAPLIGMAAALLAWDALRRPSPPLFVLAAARNDPGRLLRSDEVLPHLGEWLTWGQFIVGAPTLLFTLTLAVSTVWRTVHEAARRHTMTDLILLGFGIGYFFVHWLVAFNTYDRYLLPLLPLMAVLAARACAWLWGMLRRRLSRPELIVAAGAVTLSLIGGAREAAEGRSIYNAEREATAGIIALADTLNALPTATVIYDHWLGWSLGYYMGAWHDKRRVYYPTPGALAEGARLLPEREPRYLPAPSNMALHVWLDALSAAGFSAERTYAAGGYVVYRLTPPS
ncbi:MAG: glycosyltransferase family 39 protein [bacterium]|nr:glycosyltransferase family 39 protein [bacterium]